jgi:hypothetical protein
MANRLKYDKKRRQVKDKELALKQVGERALGFIKSGTLDMGLGLDASPQAELHALEEYVEELNHLREELQNKWNFVPEFQRVSWWVGSEITHALERIVHLEIQLTKVR